MAIAGAVTSGQAEPAESLPLAVSIANPESRIHTLQYIIESWADTDREKAAAWINNSTITRAEKDQLLSLDVFARKSEECNLGKECRKGCRYRWSPYY